MPASPAERPVTRRRGARVIVVAGDEVLLQADTDPGLPGSRFWQTPGGGIDPGEGPAEAAVRELLEETGLAVEVADLGAPLAVRRVTHGYSDRILIQEETFYRIDVERFEPVAAGLTERERQRRVGTDWHRLADLPDPVWPAELAELVAAPAAAVPRDLGDVEESTVPVR